MQIYELTQPKQEHLDEVVGGLARMAGQKLAQTGVGQAVGRAVGAAKQGFQQSAIGQTLQKAGDIEQQAKAQANTQALAKASLQQWNNKVLQLTQAASGQPIDEKDYKNNLTDFVQKVMLGGKSIDSLDSSPKPKIATAIDTVVTDRNDRTKMQTAFNNLVTQATVARTDTAKSTPTGGMQTKIENKNPLQINVNGTIYQTDQDASGSYTPWIEFQTGKPAPATITSWMLKNLQKLDPSDSNLQKVADAVATGTPTQQSSSAAGSQSSKSQTQQPNAPAAGGLAQMSQAKNFLSSLISGTQQQGMTKYLQGVTVNSTKNADVDGFLNALGVKTR